MGFFKKLKKKFKKFRKKIKKEIKRLPGNVMKYSAYAAPLLGTIIPGAGGLLTSVLGGFGGGAGSEVMTVAPQYPQGGGTGLGGGGLGRAPQGVTYGGRGVIAAGTIRPALAPTINPMLLIGGGALVLFLLLGRK